MSDSMTAVLPESAYETCTAASVGARLRRMVDEHGDFIWRTLRRLGVSEVDDATQQVFLVAAGKVSTIREGAERSYLFGVAMNVAAHVRRAKARGRELPVGDDLQAFSGGPTPEETVAGQQARALLDQILDALPLDLRAVFVLHEIEELTMAQIAELTNLAPGTVASRLRRARAKFHQLVQRLREATDVEAVP